MKFTDKEIEVVITGKRCGSRLDYTVRSNARDVVRTIATLQDVVRRLRARMDDSRYAASSLVLPSDHKAILES